MIIGIGTDIIEVSRIKDAIEKYGERFRNRIFTQTEQEYSESFNQNKYLHYSARFAAKESFSKAIGTGLTDGFKFSEIGIKNEESGKPVVVLSGGLLEKWGHCEIQISLSHTQEYAVAYVVLSMNEEINQHK
ncbi:MAG: acpS [Ignavibacteria bacterium]|nr:acpS [Ignavibacteria bacterium]